MGFLSSIKKGIVNIAKKLGYMPNFVPEPVAKKSYSPNINSRVSKNERLFEHSIHYDLENISIEDILNDSVLNYSLFDKKYIIRFILISFVSFEGKQQYYTVQLGKQFNTIQSVREAIAQAIKFVSQSNNCQMIEALTFRLFERIK